MRKEEKTWIDKERQRELERYNHLYDDPYHTKEDERLKVTETEEANYAKNHLKKLALIGLASLIIALPISNYVVKTYQEKHAIETQQEANMIQGIKVDNIILEIATPDMRIENGVVSYVAPQGFMRSGDLCYRLSCKGEAPDGYVKDSDGKTIYPVDAEIKYQAPKGFILVGDKAVQVIDATVKEKDGITVYEVPDGYNLVGRLGIKIEPAVPLVDEKGNEIDINDTVDPIATTVYSVPAGYILSGTKGVKTVYCNATAKTVNGVTTYSVPEGYTLSGTKGVKKVVINATVTTTYSAPEGYILIGGKCYKVVVPEKTMGR
jgi:hypothetical protein